MSFFASALETRGAVLVLCLCLMLAGAYLSGVRLSFNISGSLPFRVFLTVRGKEISCGSGSIGLFRLKVRNPYWDYGAVFAKRFVGCPGDKLRTEGGRVLLKRQENRRRERA